MADVPFAPELEAAVVGAMLRDAGVRRRALGLLDPDDFHDPWHGQVFGAIASLDGRGEPCDPPLIADLVGRPVSEVAALATVAPLAHAATHIFRVAELGGFRRVMRLADALADAAREQDTVTIDRLLGDPMAYVLPNCSPDEDAVDIGVLAMEADNQADFVLPGLLARTEIVMWVGEAGWGKSTLLRQIGVCAACGLDPVTRAPVPPRRVLMVDCQESRAQAARQVRKLLAVAGPQYQGGFEISAMHQGIDLTSPRWQRWLDDRVVRSRADLVILGPLYNLVRGTERRSKNSEETAELAMTALNELLVRRDVAMMVEAHAPHGDALRPRGSKVWEDWPDFGFGLKPGNDSADRSFDVVRFRGDRHDRSRWPKRYVQGVDGGWPWEAAN